MTTLRAPELPIRGKISLSGSKSISNRLLILNEVLKSNTRLNNLSNSEDTQLLEKALKTLRTNNHATIDVHHAGTDLRFLTALLANTPGQWLLTGSARMKERPVAELVSALRALGAEISYVEQKGFPPLQITGKPLQGGEVFLDSSVSSQFVSAVLLAASLFEKGVTVHLTGKTVSRPYIDMTIALLKEFGLSVKESDETISVLALAELRENATHIPENYSVESDWSSASYWYSMCALCPHSQIELSLLNTPSLQADAVLPDLYAQLGVSSTPTPKGILLKSVNPSIASFKYDFTHCPDIAQTIAVTCFGLGIHAQLNGLQTLKLKETNRLEALKSELEKLGAKVLTTDASLEIFPAQENKKHSHTPLIQTYNDHRMALSFAPLALVLKELNIEDAAVVNKSYPGFWEDLKSVGFSVNLQP